MKWAAAILILRWHYLVRVPRWWVHIKAAVIRHRELHQSATRYFWQFPLKYIKSAKQDNLLSVAMVSISKAKILCMKILQCFSIPYVMKRWSFHHWGIRILAIHYNKGYSHTGQTISQLSNGQQLYFANINTMWSWSNVGSFLQNSSKTVIWLDPYVCITILTTHSRLSAVVTPHKAALLTRGGQ